MCNSKLEILKFISSFFFGLAKFINAFPAVCCYMYFCISLWIYFDIQVVDLDGVRCSKPCNNTGTCCIFRTTVSARLVWNRCFSTSPATRPSREINQTAATKISTRRISTGSFYNKAIATTTASTVVTAIILAATTVSSWHPIQSRNHDSFDSSCIHATPVV